MSAAGRGAGRKLQGGRGGLSPFSPRVPFFRVPLSLSIFFFSVFFSVGLGRCIAFYFFVAACLFSFAPAVGRWTRVANLPFLSPMSVPSSGFPFFSVLFRRGSAVGLFFFFFACIFSSFARRPWSLRGGGVMTRGGGALVWPPAHAWGCCENRKRASTPQARPVVLIRTTPLSECTWYRDPAHRCGARHEAAPRGRRVGRGGEREECQCGMGAPQWPWRAGEHGGNARPRARTPGPAAGEEGGGNALAPHAGSRGGAPAPRGKGVGGGGEGAGGWRAGTRSQRGATGGRARRKENNT